MGFHSLKTGFEKKISRSWLLPRLSGLSMCYNFLFYVTFHRDVCQEKSQGMEKRGGYMLIKPKFMLTKPQRTNCHSKSMDGSKSSSVFARSQNTTQANGFLGFIDFRTTFPIETYDSLFSQYRTAITSLRFKDRAAFLLFDFTSSHRRASNPSTFFCSKTMSKSSSKGLTSSSWQTRLRKSRFSILSSLKRVRCSVINADNVENPRSTDASLIARRAMCGNNSAKKGAVSRQV